MLGFTWAQLQQSMVFGVVLTAKCQCTFSRQFWTSHTFIAKVAHYWYSKQVSNQPHTLSL